MSKIVLKIGQIAILSAVPRDAAGNVARLDGDLAWSVGDSAIASLAVDEQGRNVLLPKLVGTTILNAIGDADLSEAIRNIIGEAEVEVLPGDAVTIAINAEVTDAPAAPAPVEPTPVEPAPAPEPVPEPSPEEPTPEEPQPEEPQPEEPQPEEPQG